jgi:hypothetical protein
MPLNVDIRRHSGKMPQKTFYIYVIAGVFKNVLKGL